MLPTLQMYPVFAHLPEVLDHCVQLRPGPWKTAGQQTRCGGGLILSMDLQQDRLPRQHLETGLAFCGCQPPLQAVLLQWLFQAQYPNLLQDETLAHGQKCPH